MPSIHLTTMIHAPVEVVFDLSRSIDLHKKSMSHTKEEAVAGTTMGLINLQETVTWKARHLGKTRVLKSKITSLKAPVSFTDEMIDGDFRSLRHEHYFKPVNNGTLMIDYMHYEMPYGFIGSLVDRFYLNKYLVRLLETRNSLLKKCAESEQWRKYLSTQPV
ncbi:SRPBCC family protein [Flavihumibacter stibioxidans]|uniref:Cell division protein n=1 Tax=Flavihumibacter stibioxidans TaxID=1834163 RepID=A0ABR7MCM0_9BACT|nr:SRPBCC family protein [Flavihumibacter stibioxidans]MBC6492769.1 cell division protein [Flavihumibacter stibioxidans]